MVDAVSAATLRTVTLLPLKKKLITGVVLGTVLTNIGLKDIIVSTGKKGTGTPQTVPPDGILGLNKGASNIVVYNPAVIGTAKFTVTTK